MNMDGVYLFSPLVDVVVSLEDCLPIQSGETKSVGSMTMSAGGGANTLFAASRVGLSIAPFGTIGCDELGKRILSDYAKERISTDYIQTDASRQTASVIVLVDSAGKHAFASILECYLGDLTKLSEAIQKSSFVIA